MRFNNLSQCSLNCFKLHSISLHYQLDILIMKYILLIFIVIHLQLNAQTAKQFQPASYQDDNRDKRIEATFPVVEQLFKTLSAQNNIPGYSFGILIDGKLVFKGSGGYANLADSILATTRSMFRVASMSKSFTALAILQLRDQGLLHLDDPIEKYIPSFKGQALTADAPAITIRHLLSHSAGFPEDNPWGDRQLDDTEAALLELIEKGISFSTTAGLSYEYSNLGFTILGYIIHKVAGISYDAYIKKNILAPLGMSTTTYSFTDIPKEKLANGYRFIHNAWVKENLLADGIYGAMGGMISSVEMFSKYIAMHQAAWPERNDSEAFPIKRSTLREMHQPAQFISLNPNFTYPSGRTTTSTSSYTFGLNWMQDASGRKIIGHSGGLPGFGSNWRFMPDYGLAVVYFGNRTYAPASKFTMAVLDTIVQLAKLKPRQVSISPILEQRKNELLKILIDWDYRPAIFADNFFDDYLLADLITQSAAIFKKAGAIKSVDRLIPENQLRGTCIIHCENKKLQLSFTLTPENPGLVQEYHLIEID